MAKNLIDLPNGRYILGCDLGQSVDPTALAILRVTGPAADRVYQALGYRRLPLGMPYHEIRDAVDYYYRQLHFGGAGYWPRRCKLVMDATGPGKPIFDEFKKLRRVDLVGVSIHGGHQVSFSGGLWRVPKAHLAGTLEVLLEQARLRLSPHLPQTAELLREELRSFRREVDRSTGHEAYEAERGQHDDLVVSHAIGCWWGERAQLATPATTSAWYSWQDARRRGIVR